MCGAPLKGILKANAKLTDKIITSNPVARRLEKDYGIRPHGSAIMLGRAAGYKRTNTFYQPGGGGYSEPDTTRTYQAPGHSLSISQYRKRQGGGS